MDSGSSCLCSSTDPTTDPAEYLEALKKKYLDRAAKLQAQQQELEKKIMNMEAFIGKPEEPAKSAQSTCPCNPPGVPRVFPETPVRDVPAVSKTMTDVIQNQQPVSQQCSFFQKMMENAKSILSIKCQCTSAFVSAKSTNITPTPTSTTTPTATDGTSSEQPTKEDDCSCSAQEQIVDYDNTLTDKSSRTSICSCDDITEPSTLQEVSCSCNILVVPQSQQVSMDPSSSTPKGDTASNPSTPKSSHGDALTSSGSRSGKGCAWKSTESSDLISGDCTCDICRCDSSDIDTGNTPTENTPLSTGNIPLPTVAVFSNKGDNFDAQIQAAASVASKCVCSEIPKPSATKAVTCCKIASCPTNQSALGKGDSLNTGIQVASVTKNRATNIQVPRSTVGNGSCVCPGLLQNTACDGNCSLVSRDRQAGPDRDPYGQNQCMQACHGPCNPDWRTPYGQQDNQNQCAEACQNPCNQGFRNQGGGEDDQSQCAEDCQNPCNQGRRNQGRGQDYQNQCAEACQNPCNQGWQNQGGGQDYQNQCAEACQNPCNQGRRQDGQNQCAQCAFVGSPFLNANEMGVGTSRSAFEPQKTNRASSASKVPCDCNTSQGPKKVCQSSVFSLTSNDILEMQNITELAKKEKEMKAQIAELQKRERQYQQATKNVENLVTKTNNPCCSCQGASAPPNMNAEIEKISRELRLENQILKTELTDMKVELKHCLEKIEGPMKQKLETEKQKCECLQRELQDASKSMLVNQDAYTRDMNQLKLQLCCACTNISELNQMNQRLKDEMCQLDCLCQKLEDDLMKQKVSEAETIKRLTSRKNVPSAKESEEFRCDSSLDVIARKLSKTLKDLAPCEECSKLPAELAGAARCIKDLTDMVRKRKTAKPSTTNGCNCCQSRAPSKPAFRTFPEEEEECCTCCGDGGGEKAVKTLLPVPPSFDRTGGSSKFDVDGAQSSYYSAKGEPKGYGKCQCGGIGEPGQQGKPKAKDQPIQVPSKIDKECKAPCSEVMEPVRDEKAQEDLAAEKVPPEKPVQVPEEPAQTEIRAGGAQLAEKLTQVPGQVDQGCSCERIMQGIGKPSAAQRASTTSSDARHLSGITHGILDQLSDATRKAPQEGQTTESTPDTSLPTELTSTLTSGPEGDISKTQGELPPGESRGGIAEIPTKEEPLTEETTDISGELTSGDTGEAQAAQLESVPKPDKDADKESHDVPLETPGESKSVMIGEREIPVEEKRFGGEFPYDAVTKAYATDELPTGLHVTTTITDSGTLEIITEGPGGIIETTLTYTAEGNIEVVTEMAEHPEDLRSAGRTPSDKFATRPPGEVQRTPSGSMPCAPSETCHSMEITPGYEVCDPTKPCSDMDVEGKMKIKPMHVASSVISGPSGPEVSTPYTPSTVTADDELTSKLGSASSGVKPQFDKTPDLTSSYGPSIAPGEAEGAVAYQEPIGKAVTDEVAKGPEGGASAISRKVASPEEAESTTASLQRPAGDTLTSPEVSSTSARPPGDTLPSEGITSTARDLQSGEVFTPDQVTSDLEMQAIQRPGEPKPVAQIPLDSTAAKPSELTDISSKISAPMGVEVPEAVSAISDKVSGFEAPESVDARLPAQEAPESVAVMKPAVEAPESIAVVQPTREVSRDIVRIKPAVEVPVSVATMEPRREPSERIVEKQPSVEAPVSVAVIEKPPSVAVVEAPESVAVMEPSAEAPVSVATMEPAVEAPESIAAVEAAPEAPESIVAVEPAVEAPESIAAMEPAPEAPESIAAIEPAAEAPEIIAIEEPEIEVFESVAEMKPEVEAPESVAVMETDLEAAESVAVVEEAGPEAPEIIAGMELEAVPSVPTEEKESEVKAHEVELEAGDTTLDESATPTTGPAGPRKTCDRCCQTKDQTDQSCQFCECKTIGVTTSGDKETITEEDGDMGKHPHEPLDGVKTDTDSEFVTISEATDNALAEGDGIKKPEDTIDEPSTIPSVPSAGSDQKSSDSKIVDDDQMLEKHPELRGMSKDKLPLRFLDKYPELAGMTPEEQEEFLKSKGITDGQFEQEEELPESQVPEEGKESGESYIIPKEIVITDDLLKKYPQLANLSAASRQRFLESQGHTPSIGEEEMEVDDDSKVKEVDVPVDDLGHVSPQDSGIKVESAEEQIEAKSAGYTLGSEPSQKPDLIDQKILSDLDFLKAVPAQEIDQELLKAHPELVGKSSEEQRAMLADMGYILDDILGHLVSGTELETDKPPAAESTFSTPQPSSKDVSVTCKAPCRTAATPSDFPRKPSDKGALPVAVSSGSVGRQKRSISKLDKEPSSKEVSITCRAPCRSAATISAATPKQSEKNIIGDTSSPTASKSRSISLQKRPSSRDDSASCKASCRTISVQSSKTKAQSQKELREIVAARSDTTTTSSSSDARQKEKARRKEKAKTRPGEVPSIVSELSDRERPVIESTKKPKTSRRRRPRAIDCMKCNCPDPCNCEVCTPERKRQSMNRPVRSCDCPPPNMMMMPQMMMPPMQMTYSMPPTGHAPNCRCNACVCDELPPLRVEKRRPEADSPTSDEGRSKQLKNHPSDCECVDCLCLPKIKKLASTKEYPVVYDTKQVYNVKTRCESCTNAKNARRYLEQQRSRIPISTTTPNPPRARTDSKQEAGPSGAEEQPPPAEEQPQPVEEPPAPAEEPPAPAEEPPAPAEEPPAPAEEPPAPAEEPPAPAEEPPKQESKPAVAPPLATSDSAYNSVACDCPECVCSECPDEAKRPPPKEAPPAECPKSDKDCCCKNEPCTCEPCTVEELTKKLRETEEKLAAAEALAQAAAQQAAGAAPAGDAKPPDDEEECTCVDCVCPGADSIAPSKVPSAAPQPPAEQPQGGDGDEHPPDCDCIECECPGADGAPKAPAPAPPPAGAGGDEECDCNVCACPGSTSAPGEPGEIKLEACDCKDCKCSPCADPNKQSKEEPPPPPPPSSEEPTLAACDCADCKCSPCADPKRVPGVKEEPKVEEKGDGDDECDCTECKCEVEAAPPPPPVEEDKGAGEGPQDDECDCTTCECPVDEGVPDKESKFTDMPEKIPHPEDCDCDECNCLEEIIQTDLVDQTDQAVQPPAEKEVHALSCACPECFCPECTSKEVHAPACQCGECLCEVCDKKEDQPGQAGDQPPIECSCIKCMCDACSDPNRKSDKEEVGDTEILPCACVECKCESCSDPNKQGEKEKVSEEEPHEDGCKCVECICKECYMKLAPLKHEDGCDCAQCVCLECLKKMQGDQPPAPPPADSERGPGCTCAQCICIDCKGTGKVEEPAPPPPPAEGTGDDHPPVCDCPVCQCHESDTAKPEEGDHSDQCTCPECQCKPCFKKEQPEEECTCKKCECVVCSKKIVERPPTDDKETHSLACECTACQCGDGQGDGQAAAAEEPPAEESTEPPPFEPLKRIECDCKKCSCYICKKDGVTMGAGSDMPDDFVPPPFEIPVRIDCICTRCSCVFCNKEAPPQKHVAAQPSIPAVDMKQVAVQPSAHPDGCPCCKCSPCPKAPAGADQPPAEQPSQPADNFVSAQQSKAGDIQKPEGMPIHCVCPTCTCGEGIIKTTALDKSSTNPKAVSTTGDCYQSAETLVLPKPDVRQMYPDHPESCDCPQCKCEPCADPKLNPDTKTNECQPCNDENTNKCQPCNDNKQSGKDIKESVKTMDNVALVKSIQAANLEKCECKDQIDEIKKTLEKIKCACSEAEMRSTQSVGQTMGKDMGPIGGTPFVKKASVFGQTMSGLKMALSNLQAKCKAKDKMIEAMTTELAERGTTDVFDKVLDASVKIPMALDYDQAEDVKSIDRAQLSTKVIYPPTELKDEGTAPCDLRCVASKGVEVRTHKHKKKKDKQDKQDKSEKSDKASGKKVDCSCSKPQITQKEEKDCQKLDLTGFEVIDIRRITEDSLIVKWNAAENDLVQGYDIYVNGSLASKVMSGTRTSAMMHSLDLSKSVQITIYAVTKCGRVEPPALAIYEIKEIKGNKCPC